MGAELGRHSMALLALPALLTCLAGAVWRIVDIYKNAYNKDY